MAKLVLQNGDKKSEINLLNQPPKERPFLLIGNTDKHKVYFAPLGKSNNSAIMIFEDDKSRKLYLNEQYDGNFQISNVTLTSFLRRFQAAFGVVKATRSFNIQLPLLNIIGAFMGEGYGGPGAIMDATITLFIPPKAHAPNFQPRKIDKIILKFENREYIFPSIERNRLGDEFKGVPNGTVFFQAILFESGKGASHIPLVKLLLSEPNKNYVDFPPNVKVEIGFKFK